VTTFRLVFALCSLAAAGCAAERTAPTQVPAAPAVAATPESAQAPAGAPLPPGAPGAGTPDTTPAPTRTAAPSAATSTPPAVTAPPIAATPQPKPAATASQAPAGASTGPADQRAGDTAPSPPSTPNASQPPADTLDFTALGERLRATKAIGVLTKLSVKNQADDLLEQFRSYYKRQSTATLPDLHRAYDMLVLKLLSLLQDGDPPLATDINRSRTAIWDILSDQKKFIDSNLMAGASL
jgi:hypothetical protein